MAQRDRGTAARTRAQIQELSHNLSASQCLRKAIERMTPAGLEGAIPGSVGRCLIHWATGPPALQKQGEQERRESRLRLLSSEVEV